jgi:hypothetical protein
MDEGIVNFIYPALHDLKGGAGALDAYAAVLLAAPEYFTTTGHSGRYVSGVDLVNDFTIGYWNVTFEVPGLNYSGYRLRAVIAWDATPAGCDSNGTNCTGSQLDADLDLWVYDNNTSHGVGSTTWDSSWEMVDIPVTEGHSYSIKVRKWSNYSPVTYIGVAWNTYVYGA